MWDYEEYKKALASVIELELKRLHRLTGVTKKELCRRIGFSGKYPQSTYYQIIHGKRDVSIRDLCGIANVSGEHVSHILAKAETEYKRARPARKPPESPKKTTTVR